MKRIKKMGLPITLGLVVLLTAANIIACVDVDAVGYGTLCTNCNTNADCKDGMKCNFFLVIMRSPKKQLTFVHTIIQHHAKQAVTKSILESSSFINQYVMTC